jgi:hypothetical protein
MKPPQRGEPVRAKILSLLQSGAVVTKRDCCLHVSRTDDHIGRLLCDLEAEGLARRVGTRPVPVTCRTDRTRIVHWTDAVLWAAGDGRMTPEYRTRVADRVVQRALKAAAPFPVWLGGRMGAESRAL